MNVNLTKKDIIHLLRGVEPSIEKMREVVEYLRKENEC